MLYWVVNPSTNTLVEGGQLYDAQGNVFYAYPSIAVNSQTDALIGMARFTAADYPSAAYTGRASGPYPPGLAAPYVYAESSTCWDVGQTKNRWGDYSATVVDPADPTSFWTLQETVVGNTQWSTSWAQVPALS